MSQWRTIVLVLIGLAVVALTGLGITQLSWTQDLAEIVGASSTESAETATITATVESLAAPAPALQVAPAELVFRGVRRSPWGDVSFDGPIQLTIAEAEDKTFTLLYPPVYSPDLPGQQELVVTKKVCDKASSQVFTTYAPTATDTAIPTAAPTATPTATATETAEATAPSTSEAVGSTPTPSVTASATPTPTPEATFAPIGPICYQVSIENVVGETALKEPGVYSSTIQVSAGDGTEPTSVAVKVKVGYSILWPILMVVFGILTAEGLVWWGKHWGHYGWGSRRAQWLDLLSEKLEWTKTEGKHKALKEEALRHIKGELREEHKKLDKWLEKATTGKVTIGQLPASRAEAEEMVAPLRDLAAYYLVNPDDVNSILNKLRDALAEGAGGMVVRREAQSQLRQAVTTDIPRLYKGLEATEPYYRGLKELWSSATEPKPDHPLLVAAWKALQGINKEAAQLSGAFTARKKSILDMLGGTELTSLSVAGDELGAHLKAFQAKVVEPAKRQRDAVKAVDPKAIGQSLTFSVFDLFAQLGTPCSNASNAVNKANQPLKQATGNTVGAGAVQPIKKLLAELGKEIAGLSKGKELREQAIRDIMLKAVRENLRKADAQMSQPQADLKKVWSELSSTYDKDHRFVQIGRRLERLPVVKVEGADKSSFEDSVKAAYLWLLKGDALAAEIELERAEAILSKQWLAQLWNRIKQRGSQIQKSLTGLRSSTPAKGGASQEAPNYVGWIVIIILFAVAAVIALLPQPTFPVGQSISARNWTLVVWGLRNYVPWIALCLGVVLALIPISRFLRLNILWNELKENLLPWLKLKFLQLSSQLLTIAVAVALILIANNLADIADTWGSPFDFITAFTWGIVANRLSTPVQSITERVGQLLSGEEPSLDESSEESEEEGSESTE